MLPALPPACMSVPPRLGVADCGGLVTVLLVRLLHASSPAPSKLALLRPPACKRKRRVTRPAPDGFFAACCPMLVLPSGRRCRDWIEGIHHPALVICRVAQVLVMNPRGDMV